MEWYLAVIKNYAVFSGRARRKEFWMFTLFNIVISIVLGIVDGVIGTNVPGLLYSLAVLIPGLAVGARRLHDTGRSALWLLIGLVPILGGLVLLYFFVLEGEPNDNAHGRNPKLLPAGA